MKLSFSKADMTAIPADFTFLSERIAKLVDRVSSSHSDKASLRLFYAWRLLTLKSKDTLATNLVNVAKQLPELTRIILPQVPGM